MKDNVLITGGFGFIGSHIADALSSQTDSKVFVYDVNGRIEERKDITIIKGDIFDSGKLLQVMVEGEIRNVIHMIGLASIPSCRENPHLSHKLNVASVQAVLDAMRTSGANHLVFPSTAAVYGAANGPKVNEEVQPKPSTVYGTHKLAAEQLINDYSEDYGFKPTILRLFNVYGDLNKEQGVISFFLRKAIAGEPLIVKGGSQLRDFVHLHDVVQAFVNSLNGSERLHETINVGSGVGLAISEIARMIKQSFPTVKVEYDSSSGDEYSIYADISRMKKTLGLTPTPPSKGIPAFIQECKLYCTQMVRQ